MNYKIIAEVELSVKYCNSEKNAVKLFNDFKPHLQSSLTGGIGYISPTSVKLVSVKLNTKEVK